MSSKHLEGGVDAPGAGDVETVEGIFQGAHDLIAVAWLFIQKVEDDLFQIALLEQVGTELERKMVPVKHGWPPAIKLVRYIVIVR
jgi:hypothetical protein